ncbi:MAG TPA: preprotein translocase subunit SecG [Patescibacteria group bacterium]|nr:preprotein translocase subunit SecG [Patescibacteria group bacterium]
MGLKEIISIAQIVISILLILSILLQSRGAGLSGTFGGDSAVYSTRRGPEKFLYWLTIILALCFVGLAIASLILK